MAQWILLRRCLCNNALSANQSDRTLPRTKDRALRRDYLQYRQSRLFLVWAFSLLHLLVRPCPVISLFPMLIGCSIASSSLPRSKMLVRHCIGEDMMLILRPNTEILWNTQDQDPECLYAIYIRCHTRRNLPSLDGQSTRRGAIQVYGSHGRLFGPYDIHDGCYDILARQSFPDTADRRGLCTTYHLDGLDLWSLHAHISSCSGSLAYVRTYDQLVSCLLADVGQLRRHEGLHVNLTSQ